LIVIVYQLYFSGNKTPETQEEYQTDISFIHNYTMKYSFTKKMIHPESRQSISDLGLHPVDEE